MKYKKFLTDFFKCWCYMFMIHKTRQKIHPWHPMHKAMHKINLRIKWKRLSKEEARPFYSAWGTSPAKYIELQCLIMHKTIINASTGHWFFIFCLFHILTFSHFDADSDYFDQYVARDKRGMWAYHIPQIPFLFSTHFHVKRGPWQVTSSWLMKNQGQTLRCFGSLEQRNNLSRMMPIYQYLSTTHEQ